MPMFYSDNQKECILNFLKRSQSATTIQKHFRGHRVRVRYSDFKVNDITHAKDPVGYWVERILKEVVGEMVCGVFVGLEEEVYSPVEFLYFFIFHDWFWSRVFEDISCIGE